ncbi:MAG: AAA family ATPase, partial [Oligoflexia bacterium]|nr:AAA family ATPase [Oligoflexia bacterium]
MDTFYGRNEELTLLKEQLAQKRPSLITIQGRRRVGKSTLIKYFASQNQITLFEFQGLPPRPKLSNNDQLKHFASTLSQYLNVKKIEFHDWSEAFAQLGKLSSNKKQIIFLDEISWMGGKDPDFAGKLKVEWDRELSQKSGLMLVLCGSVSSWIQKNILQNTGFVGRVSLEIYLKELSLKESYQLLTQYSKKLSTLEFAQIVAITGGVPRYLEAFDIRKSSESNIKKLCFSREGLLFSEFEKIFAEIFGKRNTFYSNILKSAIEKRLSPSELAKTIDHPLNGDFTEMLSDLELGGFITRDYTWDLSGKSSKISRVRISDNYSRFYLKYILPKQSLILKKSLQTTDELAINWPTIFGYQFENLVLQNASKLFEIIGIPYSEIEQFGSFFQTATKARKGVQIDFLIQARKGLLHLCEIKSGSRISTEVIEEVKEKTFRLKLPKKFSVRHYLIYLGELSDALVSANYFDK